ncbi:SDR family NAD(P)-dependent oxidoreductase [Blastopirellula marina]|uniref:3-oxoacyl-ACP reductase n=1 Tax=Blastopirellula marina TaxID=124 RepID=A0A2S8F6J6_9BACT|nr:SDR family NAD(P)-dependent oxidoreductase [Blastopirellula marina]PQO27787.1 3-oxoacyl-ACP reductase [Blastopirellula marina]PTL41527.1 SDR family NAD(P)-dependent oxidoreductase [Blastopirellula marina]
MSVRSLFDLTGRSALITGGSKGIGKTLARAFAASGANVCITARHQDELESAVEEISQGLSVRVGYRVCDMADRAAVDAMAVDVLKDFQGIDILINNAGTNRPEVLTETTDEVWDQVLELNFTACMRLARHVVPDMKEKNWGRIIHLSSVMALASNPGRGLYSGTKAALIGMAKAHALELGPYGITVNCLCPGPIATDLPMSLLNDEQKQRFADRTALKRWGKTIDMVGPALLLGSDAGAYITGTTILADGGLTCRTFD